MINNEKCRKASATGFLISSLKVY